MDGNASIAEAAGQFERFYGRRPLAAAYAPGRVNLIGEHTDYNDGLALPVAIQQRIITLAAPRSDGFVLAHSLQVGQPVRFSVTDRGRKSQWDDALRGVIAQLEKEGGCFAGMDLLFSGDVPVGAGLSSSAAFTVSAALCLAGLSGLSFDPVALALLAQRVEHEFMGVQCGILDQMAICASREDHALLLDCRDLSLRHVPIKGAFEIVVCHTGVTRALAAGKYNERRDECARGLAVLSQIFQDLVSLRDITEEMIEAGGERLGQTLGRRLRHVVGENQRVIAACEAMENGDARTLGGLIDQSHQSLRDDYEVSCAELDIMTDLARQVPGCHGARLVGAGFGGCAIAIVDPRSAGLFCETMPGRYEKRSGRKGKFFLVRPGPGAKIADMDGPKG